jgi:hypothetical protein
MTVLLGIEICPWRGANVVPSPTHDRKPVVCQVLSSLTEI